MSDIKKPNKKEICFLVTKENDNKSLKFFLRKHCDLSSRTLAKLKRENMGITRNGALIKANELVRENDKIVISLPQEINDIVAVKGNLDIVYEDDYILCVNKPYNMPVHPTKRHQLDTLSNLVSFHMNEKGESYTFRAVNRLDKDTSGLVLIAKDRYTCAYLQISSNTEKEYVAVCEGVISEKGTVDLPIALEKNSKIKRTADSRGQKSITHYVPIKGNNSHTLLCLNLETGRTHQIRCHMSCLGHPLAGDDLYGGKLDCIDRQALHCYKLSFIHPITQKRVSLQTEIPQEFLKIVE